MPGLQEISACVTGCGIIDHNGSLCHDADWHRSIKNSALTVSPSNIDVICIPGGGVDRNGYLPPWIVASLDYALAVHNAQLAINSKPPFFLTESKGSPHAPEIRVDGRLVLESERAFDFLVACGVDKSVIASDLFSMDTIGNAYAFRRFLDGAFGEIVECDVDAYRRFEIPASPSVLIIGADYHMPRLGYLHRRLLTLATSRQCDLYFITINTEDYLDPAIRQVRFEKERSALKKMQAPSSCNKPAFADVTTLLGFEDWLFKHHDAYNGSAKQPPAQQACDDYCYASEQNRRYLVKRAGEFANYTGWLEQISVVEHSSRPTKNNVALIATL